MNKLNVERKLLDALKIIPSDQHPDCFVLDDNDYKFITGKTPYIISRDIAALRTSTKDIKIYSNYQWEVIKEAKRMAKRDI